MAFPRLDIVDPENLTTVLWSFNDHGGTVNANGVKTRLSALQFGTDTDIQTFDFSGDRAGGVVVRRRDRIAPSSAVVYVAASSADVYATSLGLLNSLLDDGGVMVWQPLTGSPLRYVDFLPSPRFTGFNGHRPDLARDDQGLMISFLAQPYLSAATTTTTPTAVVNDPATGRLLSVTVTGDLPTPVSVTSQMNAGSAVQRVHLAHHAATSANIADLIAETAWAQLEASGRGWTRSGFVDATTATVADASPGSGTSVTRTSYATVPEMARRVRLTRTTKLNSLRGAWDVSVRVKASAASRHVLQLGWSPTTAEPAIFTNPPVTHDVTDATAFGWVVKNLGSIYLPTDTSVSLGGLSLDFSSARTSGTGNLDWDYMDLTPRSGQGVVVVTGEGSVTVTDGKDLTTPIGNPAGGTAGTISGESLLLDTSTDNAGLPRNSGVVYPIGRWRATYRIRAHVPLLASASLVIRNVTTSANAASRLVSALAETYEDHVLEFDANGTSAYQVQIENESLNTVEIRRITLEFVPSLASTEQLRTDPGNRQSAERLDASSNLTGYLNVEGEMPMVLSPGPNLIFTRADDVPLSGYGEGQNIRTRSQTITLAYRARRPL